jgi:hypothetical protein
MIQKLKQLDETAVFEMKMAVLFLVYTSALALIVEVLT